jgi:hypothetical protein
MYLMFSNPVDFNRQLSLSVDLMRVILSGVQLTPRVQTLLSDLGFICVSGDFAKMSVFS